MGNDILRQDEETVLLGDLQDDNITADESQLSPISIIDNDIADDNSDDEILDSDDEVYDDDADSDEDYEDECEISTIDSTIIKRKVRVTTLDDIDDIIDEDEELSDSERIKQIMEKNVNMPPCYLDKKQDERLKNIMTGVTIPFVLVSIVFSLFNIGRIRHSLSFLFLSLGLGVMSIFYTIRYKNLNKCTCPVCKTQSRNIVQFAILWGVLALGLLGAFIFFAVTGNVVV